MAFIKWRQAQLVKCYKVLRIYAFKKKQESKQYRPIVDKIRSVVSKRLLKEAFHNGLTSYLAIRTQKKRQYLTIDRFRNKTLLRKSIKCLNRNIALQRFHQV